MSRYFSQFRDGKGEARRRLQERLAREEMGDEAYDKAASQSDDRAFKLFGLVFIALFGLVVLGVAALGY